MPNRVLRDWTTSDAMDSLSPQAEVMFTRLIMKADDYGSFHANPKLINSALFPLKDYTKDQISDWIGECLACGLIVTYHVDEKKYIRIQNFGQRLRAMRSAFPHPADNPLTGGGQPADNGRLETKRNETETETETKPSFDEMFLRAFDEITCDRYKSSYREVDLGAELQRFRVKCDNDPDSYHSRDAAGLRTAFQYQLQNLRKNGKQTSTTEQRAIELRQYFAAKDNQGAAG